MSYNFLPNIEQPKPKPNTASGSGSNFSVADTYFFDQYENHFDVQRLIEFPIKRERFLVQDNYKLCVDFLFKEETIKKEISKGWYGANTDFDLLVQGYTQFQEPELLNSVVNKLEAEITHDLFSGIEKPKMKINDRFGLFSFDLASMAMTYVFEYFNKNGEKMDANFVQKIGENFIFKPTNEIVNQKIKRHPNGNPVVVSSVRNSLIDFEKKEKKERSVEIFITNSVNYDVSVKDFIYNSMAGISVAKNLILKGFQVKVTGLFVVNAHNSSYFHFVPAKRFNQPIDINAIAYICGDTRFFRYQAFKAFVMGYDFYKRVSPRGVGGAISDKKFISSEIEKKYIQNSQRKQADTRLYFGGSRNLEQAKKEVLEAVEILQKNYGNN